MKPLPELRKFRKHSAEQWFGAGNAIFANVPPHNLGNLKNWRRQQGATSVSGEAQMPGTRCQDSQR
jgi:hypothetical protein